MKRLVVAFVLLLAACGEERRLEMKTYDHTEMWMRANTVYRRLYATDGSWCEEPYAAFADLATVYCTREWHTVEKQETK